MNSPITSIRKSIVWVAALLFCLTLAGCSSEQPDESAASSSNEASKASEATQFYIRDDFGLLSSEEVAELETLGSTISENSGLGIHWASVADMGSSNPTSEQRTEFATNYYTDNKLGVGEYDSGILFIFAGDTRDYVTIWKGRAHQHITEDDIQKMEEHVIDKLAQDEWYDAAKEYYSQMESILAR